MMFARIVLVCAIGLSFGVSANETLRGVDEVRVVISLEESKATGLSMATLRTNIELELRELGLPITGRPYEGYFHLSVLILNMNREGSREAPKYVYFISADYYQRTAIEREDVIITSMSSTWRYSGRLGLVDERLEEKVKDICIEVARIFANDYLKANQRVSTVDE